MANRDSSKLRSGAKREHHENRLAVRSRGYFRRLGPGIVTGAADDDPSGIGTYSQAGAAAGYGFLWSAVWLLPLAFSVQEACARLALVTGKGLAAIIKARMPRWVLVLAVMLVAIANTVNIAADLASMAAAFRLIVPINQAIGVIGFAMILAITEITIPYHRYSKALRWLCLSLLAYVAVLFVAKVDWEQVATATFLFQVDGRPAFDFTRTSFELLIALAGTTISPYLFFWQATMEVEEMKHKNHLVVNKKIISDMKQDVDFGMTFSGLVMYFIILTTGTVLYNGGIHQIDTVEEAAIALKPLAGNLAYLLFAIGVIGTGLLAIPVLSGSLSYIITETFGWEQGLDKKFHEAKAFYAVIAVSLVLGLSLNYVGISPIKALIYTAILYGLTAPVLIAIILHICNNKKVMGKFTNSTRSNILGFSALIIMTVAAGALLYLQFGS